jgi:hypothetical protein
VRVSVFRRRPRAAIALVALAGLLVGACGSTEPGPSLDPEAVVRLAPSWPAHDALPAAAVAIREQCIAGAGPVVATEDRGFGVAFVLVGSPQNSGSCELQASGPTWVMVAGSAAQKLDPVPDDAFLVEVNGSGPAWTRERASAVPQIEWPDLLGIAPAGTAEVRAAVGQRAVKATMADRLFVLAWPNDTRAALLVALDANGNELARLDGPALAPSEDQASP